MTLKSQDAFNRIIRLSNHVDHRFIELGSASGRIARGAARAQSARESRDHSDDGPWVGAIIDLEPTCPEEFLSLAPRTGGDIFVRRY